MENSKMSNLKSPKNELKLLEKNDMTMNDIVAFIQERQPTYILLLCHQNADPDALCSAFAFQGLLKRFIPNAVVEIGTGQSISKLSKQILEHIPISVNTKPNVESADVIILLDTNTIEQLGDISEKASKSSAPLIVVDHHAPHPQTLKRAGLLITKQETSSTCEVIYDFFKQTREKPSLKEAKALFLGIAFDTRHFVLGNASTFEAIVGLCEAGVKPQETLPLLSLPMDVSERIARIKACKRAKLFKKGEWIIAFSQVSAYEASAARALLDLGAHAAAVAGQKNDKVEASFRCTRDFHKKTGVHLGVDIAQPLGEYLEGMGGGHAAAAGANGKGKAEEALKYCRMLFKEKLSKSRAVILK